MTVPEVFQLALRRHQSGHLTDAEGLYHQVLSLQPHHAGALHHLGIIAHQAGRHELAINLIRQSLSLAAQQPDAWSNLGEACRLTGRLDAAIDAYRRAIAIHPGHFKALSNLGNALRECGQPEAAIAACRQAIELQPDLADAQNNLGNALMDLRRFEEALPCLHRAIELRPDYPEAHYNLGIALRECAKNEASVQAYRRAIELRPTFADAHMNLANTLTELGRYRESVDALARALALRPDHARTHYNLGVACQSLGQLDEAAAAYRRAIELQPDLAQAHNNLGRVLAGSGQPTEAIREYRRALNLRPDSANTHSNIIVALQLLPDANSEELARGEQQLWNQRFAAPFRPFLRSFANDRTLDRRLRIGYVSADFRDHVAGRNLKPLFEQHDHLHFEVFSYSGVLQEDSLTTQFRHHSDHWRTTVGVSDQDIENTIRRDAIDILVDLSLHTADNRLPVFARKPAPLQLSFAAYPGSTGLEAIAHRISDPWLESSVALRPESSVLLVDSFWCYDPCGIDLPVNALPASRNGHITFGCLNNFCKVNESVLRLWARVLLRVPDARLILLSEFGSHRQSTLQFFADHGVPAHRLEFVPPLPRKDYLAEYYRLDLILDTFPYNGHTTSLDALWMGIPIVSLVGRTPVSRAGLSQLSNLGLPELAAHSEDQYIRIASDLAGDFSRLADLRASLRPRMESSVLMDAPRFARQIESVYRTLWRHWCQHPAEA